MYKKLLYAVVENRDGSLRWYTYASKATAECAIAYGEIKPDKPLYGARFTGEILTYEQMVTRGLIREPEVIQTRHF